MKIADPCKPRPKTMGTLPFGTGGMQYWLRMKLWTPNDQAGCMSDIPDCPMLMITALYSGIRCLQSSIVWKN
jgi:hypothetical protein